MSAFAASRARWSVVQWFAAALGVLVVVVVVGLVLGVLALSRLGDDRARTVDVLDPALQSALRLSAALLDEETGVRGYALTGDRAFLVPYTRGRAVEPRLLGDLRDAGR